MDPIKPHRILLVDDNAEIHQDFYRILSVHEHTIPADTDKYEEILFGTARPTEPEKMSYRIDSAYQGEEALELVKKSLQEKEPYALIFMDIRMPPGWNGIETIKRIWKIDPLIQMVICSAYSEHSWDDITRELGYSDNLLILKKPFEVIEINQLAIALTKKWELIANLNTMVNIRTNELEHLNSLTQATLESTEEGIIAVGLEQQILIHNEKFLTQWGISANQLKTSRAEAIFEYMSNQVDNPEIFTKTMSALLDQPRSGRMQEIQLKNNMILALYAHPQYLKNEIIGMVYSFQDITEHKMMEKQLLHQATHDTLTELPNRALLLDRINQALAHAKRFNLQVGILLLDLDTFKDINDSLGHKAGDIVLKNTANMLAEFVRANDTVARLGGDEFVLVLVSRPNQSNFLALLDKLMEQFLIPYTVEDQEIIVTASVGVSIYPQDGDNGDTLLKNADSALYHAKELGRNQYQFYMDEFNKHIMQRSELKIALSQALSRKELILNYQPLYNLVTGKILGFEALLRWHHPTMGLLYPITFMPVAEESGQIISIGEWVLRTACFQAKQWQEMLPEKLKMSINISVKQFKQKNFVSLVKNVLNETKLDPSWLELEITESLILGNVSEVIEQMLVLKELGIRFAIDDFGTGYSSLSYLKHFPFDTVKIDKTFMDNIDTDSNNASIVEAIIGMTRKMNIDVLAEGVENVNQVNFLRQHHGNQVQGYYFSKPLNEADCMKLLMKKDT